VERNVDSGGGYESHFQAFVGETREAMSCGIRIIGFIVTKIGVGRDVVGGLSSKSKKWELVVGGDT